MSQNKKNPNPMQPSEWRAAVSLSGVYALRMLGMFLVLPVLALYAHGLAGVDNSGSLKMVGLAMAAYGLTQAVLQLPLGLLSDKIGRKRVIYLGMTIFAAGSFLAAFTNDIYVLIIARAIQGAGAVSAAVTALLADLTRENVRTRAMSMIGLTIGLTFSGSLVLSPILSGIMGVQGLFALTGILSLASILLVKFYTPEPQELRHHEDTQASVSHIGEVLKNKQLLRLNYGIFALQTGLMAIFTALPFMLENLGWHRASHWQIYLPATVLGLIFMVPAIIIGETRNKLKAVFMLGISLVLAAQAALICSLSSIWVIAVILVIYFVGFNILEASMPSMVSKIAPPQLKGTAMGVYNTTQSLGVFTGGMAGGRLYHAFGLGGVFGFCCMIIGIWWAIAFFAPAPRPVKNVIFAIPENWQNHLSELTSRVQAAENVEAVSVSEDKKTLFVKVLQNQFNETIIQKILIGDK